MRVPLKGVHIVKKRLRDGKVKRYYYHRATRLPLTGKPGSLEFQEAWTAAERTITHRDEGTFAGLIRDYSQSVEFEAKKPSTQTEYRRMLAKIEAEFGTMPIAALNDPRVRRDFYEWREKVHRQSGPREGDNRLSIVSAVLSWGVQHGHIAQNYVAGFKRFHKADRSEIIWLPEHIAAFRKHAPVELQRALELALHTGQRQGDLLRLAWTNYDGTEIRLRQGKTGRHVVIPCTQALKNMLDNMERKATVILTTKGGKAWDARYFQGRWRHYMRKAKLPEDLRFHDLRGTAITMLFEAGCTLAEAASISGHSLRTASNIMERYHARTGYLAGQAITKLETHRRSK